jgi:hypothetical protein
MVTIVGTTTVPSSGTVTIAGTVAQPAHAPAVQQQPTEATAPVGAAVAPSTDRFPSVAPYVAVASAVRERLRAVAYIEQAPRPAARSAERGIDPERSGHGPTSSRTGSGWPVQGTLVLDGRVLGRWMVDHLEAEMARSTNGGSGFNARLSPSWPATAVMD